MGEERRTGSEGITLTLIFHCAHFDVVCYVRYMTAFNSHASFLHLRVETDGVRLPGDCFGRKVRVR